jgi:hypothetical protein
MLGRGNIGCAVGPPGTNPLSSGCPPKPAVMDMSPIVGLFGEAGLPPIHGLVGGGEEAWTPGW